MASENQIVKTVAADHGRNTPNTIHFGIPKIIVDASGVVGGIQYDTVNIQTAHTHQAPTIQSDSRTALSLIGFMNNFGLL